MWLWAPMFQIQGFDPQSGFTPYRTATSYHNLIELKGCRNIFENTLAAKT
jgi:hypothetical protein